MNYAHVRKLEYVFFLRQVTRTMTNELISFSLQFQYFIFPLANHEDELAFVE